MDKYITLADKNNRFQALMMKCRFNPFKRKPLIDKSFTEQERAAFKDLMEGIEDALGPSDLVRKEIKTPCSLQRLFEQFKHAFMMKMGKKRKDTKILQTNLNSIETIAYRPCAWVSAFNEPIRQHIPTWVERCDVNDGRLPTDTMIQERMQSEIDDLRHALQAARQRLECINQTVTDDFYRNLGVL